MSPRREPAAAEGPLLSASPASAAARAWCRVDFAGGTLDIWPLGLLHPGARTVNVAIDVAAEVRLSRRPEGYRIGPRGGEAADARTLAELMDRPQASLAAVTAQALGLPPVEIETTSASPRGGGLGASSALVIALIAAGEALLGRPPSSAGARAALARDLEARLMGLPTGTQDHYPALLGGALEIRHEPGGERVRRIDADLEALAASLLVIYTGQSHFSAGANWLIVRRRLDGDREIEELFSGIAAEAAEAAGALEATDLPRLGEVMSREWSLRRRLSPEVSTPAIEELLDLARSAGAWGGKACGAGGGGCLALLCPPERRAEIGRRLGAAGGKLLPARPQAGPLAVEVGGATGC